MKKLLTRVTIGTETLSIPTKEAKALLSLAKALDKIDDEWIPADVVLKEIAGKRPMGAVYLRGSRCKLGLSQKELAKMAGIHSGDISKYENGSRKITEPLAKKFAKALKTDHKRFEK